MAWTDRVRRVLGSCLGSFGEDVTYTPSGGAPDVISGIYNSVHEAIDEQGVVVSTVHPNLGIRLSDLAAEPGPEDTVVIRGNTFEVTSVAEDGEGGATLLLEKQ